MIQGYNSDNEYKNSFFFDALLVQVVRDFRGAGIVMI